LAVEFGEGLLQHLAMSGVLGDLKLLCKSLAGHQESLALLIAFSLIG
jgi:hypothetical protein